jgi:hemerythrin-like metal-binding protein
MDKIVWRDEFSVGHEVIDAQHKKLVAMINRLISSSRVTTGSETISEILAEMTDYVQVHFETEEKLMARVNYPRIEEHKAQHRAFQMKTAALIRSASLKAEPVPVVLLNYLRNWLTQHILKTDMELKAYLA